MFGVTWQMSARKQIAPRKLILQGRSFRLKRTIRGHVMRECAIGNCCLCVFLSPICGVQYYTMWVGHIVNEYTRTNSCSDTWCKR